MFYLSALGFYDTTTRFSTTSDAPAIKCTLGPLFSLFCEENNRSDLTKGAFCLAGANGLGKSTFLAAVNFGLTGIVPEAGRKFESVEEYYAYSLGFAGDFFDGRVDERDRDRAEVSLIFEVGTKIFHLTRGFLREKSFERSRFRR